MDKEEKEGGGVTLLINHCHHHHFFDRVSEIFTGVGGIIAASNVSCFSNDFLFSSILSCLLAMASASFVF